MSQVELLCFCQIDLFERGYDARFRPPSLILFSLGDEETGRTRQRVIDKTARPLQLLAILRVGQSHQALPRSGV
jgi:hypothetical protein